MVADRAKGRVVTLNYFVDLRAFSCSLLDEVRSSYAVVAPPGSVPSAARDGACAGVAARRMRLSAKKIEVYQRNRATSIPSTIQTGRLSSNVRFAVVVRFRRPWSLRIPSRFSTRIRSWALSKGLAR